MAVQIVRTYKTRTGFGKWGKVLVYKCDKCQQETHLRQNWHGPAPIGAILCQCGAQLPLPGSMPKIFNN